MLLADGLTDWVYALGAIATILGVALVALATKFAQAIKIIRSSRIESQRDGDKARQETWKENQILGEEAFKRQIDALSDENSNQRIMLQNFADETLKKLIAAHDERWECEKRYAALEERVKHLEREKMGVKNGSAP